MNRLLLIPMALSLGPGAIADQSVAIRVSAALVDSEVVQEVAALGVPTEVLLAPGETVLAAAAARCGRLPARYREILSGRVPIDLDAPASAPTPVELPACLQLPTAPDLVEVVVRENEWPRKFYEQDDAGLSWSEWLELFEANNPGYAETEVLIADRPAIVPRSPVTWSTITLPEFTMVAPEMAGRFLRDLLIEKGQGPEETRYETDTEVELFTDLSEEVLVSLGACPAGPAESDSTPYDLAQLVSVLSFNLRMLSTSQPRSSPIDAVVVIPDSGLADPGAVPFADRVQRIPTRRPYEARARAESEARHHGTHVATIALGGPIMMQLLDALEINLFVAPISLDPRPRRCRDAECAQGSIDLSDFNNLLSEIDDMRAIVNLSLGRAESLPSLEEQLDAESESLFVVAAGNHGKSLGGQNRVYPARYGGIERKSNLLTVASLEPEGRLSPFSNFGPHVDLAAPGCRLPALELAEPSGSYSIRHVSGTSFAAPLVSFTAALLRTVWPHSDPAQLKSRILHGSDIDPQLTGPRPAGLPFVDPWPASRPFVNEGRVWNPVKTLAIYQDVLEIEQDGGRRLLLGSLDDVHQLFEFCNGRMAFFREPSSDTDHLKKVARIGAGTYRIFWHSSGGSGIQAATCEQPQGSLRFTEHFTRRQWEVPWDQVVDVVFAEQLRRPL